jgi:hypothetical protein
MSRRRRRLGELTSLVDVLFILLFASLVQQRRAEGVGPATAEEPVEAAAIDAGVPRADAAPTELQADDLHQAAREVAARLDSEQIVMVAVDAAGTIRSLETGGRELALELPLLRQTGDDRVVVYAGDERPELRLCREVADSLGLDRLDRGLILVTTERPLRQLGVALVGGLRRDIARCYDDVGATALLVVTPDDPTGAAP